MRSIAGSRRRTVGRAPSRTRRRRRARSRRRPTARTAPGAGRHPTRRTRAASPRRRSRSTQRLHPRRAKRVDREHRRHERSRRGVAAELLAEHRRPRPRRARRHRWPPRPRYRASPARPSPPRARRRTPSPVSVCARTRAGDARSSSSSRARRHAARADRRRGRNPWRPSLAQAPSRPSRAPMPGDISRRRSVPQQRSRRCAEPPASAPMGRQGDRAPGRARHRERVRDRHLEAARADRAHHARLRLHEHRLDRVGDHVHRRRRAASSATAATHRGPRRARITRRSSRPSYLLIYGELPTPSERDEFSRQIRKHTLLHEDVKRFFDGFPKDAHPMATLVVGGQRARRPSTRTATTRTIPSRCSSRSSG